MFLLGEIYNFGRRYGSKDKKNRKRKIGSSLLATIPTGAAIGAGAGLLTTLAMIKLKKGKFNNLNTKNWNKVRNQGIGLVATGTGLGIAGGAITGDNYDKKMKLGKYEKGAYNPVEHAKKFRKREIKADRMRKGLFEK